MSDLSSNILFFMPLLTLFFFPSGLTFSHSSNPNSMKPPWPQLLLLYLPLNFCCFTLKPAISAFLIAHPYQQSILSISPNICDYWFFKIYTYNCSKISYSKEGNFKRWDKNEINNILKYHANCDVFMLLLAYYLTEKYSLRDMVHSSW